MHETTLRSILICFTLGTAAAASLLPPEEELVELGKRINGSVKLPSSFGFSRAVRQWNARFDKLQPRAIIYALDEPAVQASVKLLLNYSACYTVRSAGHSFPGWAVQDGCVVLDVAGLNFIEYDSSSEQVHTGPGATFWDFTKALGIVNRTTTHGFGPTVAFGGYTQGGGVGLTHRKYGLAIDNLRSARVVLTNGTLVEANATSHPELFWALRGGGGGNWGVVTSYNFQTYDASQPILYVMISWRLSSALVNETAAVWQAYMAGNQDVDFGLYWRITGNPVLGELGTTVEIYGIYTGEPQVGRTVIENYITLFPTAPHSHEMTEMAIDKAYLSFMSPFKHIPHTGFFLQSRLLSEPMKEEAYHVLAKQLDKLHVLETFTLIWMDPLGGAVSKVAPNATAFPWRNAFANFAIFVFYLEPSAEQKARAWMADTWTRLEPSMGANKVYVNFCFANATDWQEAYYGENYPRLQRVKGLYDGNRRLEFPQGIELPSRADDAH